MSSAALSHGVRTKPRHPGVAPARKAVALSSLADAFGGSLSRSNRLAADAGVQRKTVSDVASDGFRGAGSDVPYRAEMEQSFGRDFSGVRAYTGSQAAGANDKLGANAYAMGSQVAFKSANPSKDLVAHELTHVVQQSEGAPQYHGRDDIDTSGEAQADAVEGAVRSGQPASSVLGAPAAKGAGPARKKKGPAREGGGFIDKFSMGFNFSKDGFEKSYEYTIWDKMISTPIPACPVINLVVKPSVKVAAKMGADWGGENKGTGKVGVEISGSVGVGLSGGAANVAEVYAVLEPGISGGGEFRFGQQGKWSLDVGMALKVGGKLGVALGGGIVDYSFALFDLELLKFTGLNWDQAGFHKEKLGIGMGKDLEDIFKAIKAIIDKAKAAGAAIANGAVKTGKYIAKGAQDAWDFVTSW
jgi:hypothetical protein